MNAVEYLKIGAGLLQESDYSAEASLLLEIACRYEMLVDLVEDSLAEAKARWENVAHHPASRFGRDVRYLQECLDKAKAPIEEKT